MRRPPLADEECIDGSVEGAYNRAVYLPRRRELAMTWAALLPKELLEPAALLSLPCKFSPFKGVRRTSDAPPKLRLVS